MLEIGKTKIPTPVFLAPMSGVTDAPFRTQALAFGAPAVVTEMVAGEDYVQDREHFRRRAARHQGDAPHIVQLVGRDPVWMRKAANQAAAEGADIIDINMGCPSRRVTGGQSGSALMREPELARRLIAETVAGAGDCPVTVKMRLGWDDQTINACEIGSIAESEGARMVTIHARTRCQFYKGVARWKLARPITETLRVPVLINGDIETAEDANLAMAESGACGVMIGRAAIGKPWLIGQIAGVLRGQPITPPSPIEKLRALTNQLDDSCALYGEQLGIRTIRKHLAATLDDLERQDQIICPREDRVQLCQSTDTSWIIDKLLSLTNERALEVA